jgi:predicted nucleotidyltransferase
LTGVVVKSVDRAQVRRSMDAYARRLFQAFAEVDEIIVFGSFETGDYAPGSDLDVLIVLSQSTRSVRDRIPVYMPDNFPVPVDLFPFTTAELADRAPSPVLKAANVSRWRYRRT